MIRALAAATLVATLAVTSAAPAGAAFTATTASTGNALSADTVEPVTNLDLEYDCMLIGILRPVGELTWTPSASSWADGYVVERRKAGVLEATEVIPDVTTSAYTDGLGGLNLNLSTVYEWRVFTTKGTWRSSPVAVSASTPVFCI